MSNFNVFISCLRHPALAITTALSVRGKIFENEILYCSFLYSEYYRRNQHMELDLSQKPYEKERGYL